MIRLCFCAQAWKKIEETKKKAVEIMQVRMRNKEIVDKYLDDLANDRNQLKQG